MKDEMKDETIDERIARLEKELKAARNEMRNKDLLPVGTKVYATGVIEEVDESDNKTPYLINFGSPDDNFWFCKTDVMEAK